MNLNIIESIVAQMNEAQKLNRLGMTTSEFVHWAYPLIFNGHGFDRLYYLDEATALYVVCLDNRNRPLSNPVPVFLGTRNGLLVHPRDILQPALRWNSNRVIVIVTALPSEDSSSKVGYVMSGEKGIKRDGEIIERLRLAADIVGVQIYDWIHIRNDGAWKDMRGNSTMNSPSSPRVDPKLDTSHDLWDDPGDQNDSTKSGRHKFERAWGEGI